MNQLERQELLTEITLVEFTAEDDFVCGLQLGQCELGGQEGRNGVGVGKLGDQAFAGIPYDIGVVVSELRQGIYLQERCLRASIA